jgi:phosphate/sulfate permease
VIVSMLSAWVTTLPLGALMAASSVYTVIRAA